MRNFSLRSIIIDITIIIFIVICASFVLAEQPGSDAGEFSQVEEKNLTVLQKQARQYRLEGLGFQRLGNLDEAMAFYQKAIQLDPTYAVALNDLGIIYETKGFIDRAQDCYLQAIKVNPEYLSAYTNLALIYENNRDLPHAAFYWRKRFELGSPDDPWTKKAEQRFRDIALVSSETPLEDLREQEVVALLKDTAVEKYILNNDVKALARKHFEKAQQCYDKHDYTTAIKEAFDALQLDPANPDIDKFIEKVQARVLSR